MNTFSSIMAFIGGSKLRKRSRFNLVCYFEIQASIAGRPFGFVIGQRPRHPLPDRYEKLRSESSVISKHDGNGTQQLDEHAFQHSAADKGVVGNEFGIIRHEGSSLSMFRAYEQFAGLKPDETLWGPGGYFERRGLLKAGAFQFPYGPP